jgi:hypothetical protein
MEQKNTTNELEKQGNPAIVESTELKFRCPKCGGNKLHEISIWCQEMKAFMDGEIKRGQEGLYDDEGYFCCGDCDYELYDAEGVRIQDYSELILWLFEQYAQEVLKKAGWRRSSPAPSLGD